MPHSLGQKLASSEARVHALEYCFNNGDSGPAKAAAENLTNGCAAFWHRAGGNSATAVFVGYLNRYQDVLRACAAYEADFHQTDCALRTEAVLDQLLPLNELAVHSLLDAYAATGWHRSARELVARTDKADDEAANALWRLWSKEGSLLPLDQSRVEEAARAQTAVTRDAAPAAVMEAVL